MIRPSKGAGMMNFQVMLGNAGKRIDQDLIEWRKKGVRGDVQERERFRKEQFHGARAMMRLAVEAKAFLDPKSSRQRILDACKDDFLNVSAQQAEETGFDEAEKQFYVGITREAYESLAKEYDTTT
jgi:hypothetical protein